MLALLLSLSAFFRLGLAHMALYHPSMWGFNVTTLTDSSGASFDWRPVVPLVKQPFSMWWFHGHLNYPPNDGDFFELPAGQIATGEIGCDKCATSYAGGNYCQNSTSPTDILYACPNTSPNGAYHSTDLADVKGCAIGITYKSDITTVQPEDFTIFTTNHTCPWYRDTDFEIPQRMPPCPSGGCICAWFWIHSPDSGSEQMFMDGFRCNVTGSTSNVPLAISQVARRCGTDASEPSRVASPENCTLGAKQPLYWLQLERNNMFEGYYQPPFYNALYNYADGAQNDIFEDSYC